MCSSDMLKVVLTLCWLETSRNAVDDRLVVIVVDCGRESRYTWNPFSLVKDDGFDGNDVSFNDIRNEE